MSNYGKCVEKTSSNPPKTPCKAIESVTKCSSESAKPKVDKCSDGQVSTIQPSTDQSDDKCKSQKVTFGENFFIFLSFLLNYPRLYDKKLIFTTY